MAHAAAASRSSDSARRVRHVAAAVAAEAWAWLPTPHPDSCRSTAIVARAIRALRPAREQAAGADRPPRVDPGAAQRRAARLRRRHMIEHAEQKIRLRAAARIDPRSQSRSAPGSAEPFRSPAMKARPRSPVARAARWRAGGSAPEAFDDRGSFMAHSRHCGHRRTDRARPDGRWPRSSSSILARLRRESLTDAMGKELHVPRRRPEHVG